MECIRVANARHKVIIFCKSHLIGIGITMHSEENNNEQASMTDHHDYQTP